MNDYFILFMMGLLGSVHCVAMCGGLIMATAMKLGGGTAFSLAYNTGRIISYSALGALMGFIGQSIIATGLFGAFQGALPVLAGLFMVFSGLDFLGLIPSGVKRALRKAFPPIPLPSLMPFIFKRGKLAPLLLGMANGFIPCALLYAGGIKAAATGSPAEGALTMAALGAGTFLPLLFTGAFHGAIKGIKSGAVVTLSSIAIIFLGIKSIVYGAGANLSAIQEICASAIK